MKRLWKRTTATPDSAVNVANATEELQRVLAIRWWRWRRCFLEAKRLDLARRRAE